MVCSPRKKVCMNQKFTRRRGDSKPLQVVCHRTGPTAPRPSSSRWFRHSVVTGWLRWLYHKTEVVTRSNRNNTAGSRKLKMGNMAENNKNWYKTELLPSSSFQSPPRMVIFSERPGDQYYKALLSTSRGALLPHVPHKLHSKTRKILKTEAMSHARLMPPPVKAFSFFLDPKMLEKILGKVFGNIWIKHVNFQQKKYKRSEFVYFYDVCEF